MVKVLYFATIRDYTGEKETAVEKAATVECLVHLLSDRYGESFRENMIRGEAISEEIIILVNGRHIAHTGGPATTLQDGDTVAIFPIIEGG